MVTEKRKLLSFDLVIISSSFFFIFMGAGSVQQYMIPLFSSTLNRSPLACSWILASLYLSFLFWRIACGYTLKWLGDYWSLVLSSFLYAAFPLCMLFSKNYTFLLLMAIAWGWGAASLWIGASARVLDASSSKKYGASSGAFYTTAQLGQAIGVLLMGWMISVLGEDKMLFRAFLITAAGCVLILFLPQRKIKRAEPKITKVFGVLKSNRNRAIAFMQFVSSFGFGVIMSSFADMVQGYYGIAVIGSATIWFYVIRLFSSYFSGWLSDRWGREILLVLGFLFSGIGFAAAVFNHSLLVLYLAAGLLGFQFGIVPVAVMAMIGDETKPEERHLVFGALFLWRDLGVAVAILSGMYINAYSHNFTLSFAIFSALFFICAFLATKMTVRKEC